MVDKTLELSVEETNALRLKLGLKPLRINQNQLKQEEEGKKRKRNQDTQEQEKKTDNEKETQKEDTARLKDKLLAIREERLAREKVDAGRIVRPLGEPSDDDDDDGEDDLRSWVKKSRERERREQEAERTRRALQEQEGFGEDGEDEGEASAPRRPRYGSKELAGLKISHAADQFREGGQVILTLKDQGVLGEDGELNDGEDVLEETLLAQDERRKEADRLARPKSRYEEDADGDGMGGGVLSKYDDPLDAKESWGAKGGRAAALEIGGGGAVDLEKARRAEEARKALAMDSAGLAGRQRQNANPVSRSMDDFWTQEEAGARLAKEAAGEGKKRRRRKKKNLRLRGRDLDEMEREAAAAGAGKEGRGGDHGKRVEGGQARRQRDEYLKEQARRDAAYSDAMNRAAEATAAKFGREAEEEEEEEDFFAALGKARNAALAARRSETKGPDVADRLKVLERAGDAAARAAGELYAGEVFTETGEFCNALSSRPGEAGGDPDAKPALETEDVAMAEPEGSEGARVRPEAVEPAETAAVEAQGGSLGEASVGKGIGGALRLLQDRGELRKTVRWAGRTNDMKDGSVRDVVESSEGGDRNRFAQDIESALTRKDEFGRVMTPKEAFRQLCYRFHGIKASKNKQEKKIKKYLEEQKQLEQGSTSAGTSMDKLKSFQKQTSTPYLVLEGKINPGQSRDPRSSFALDEEK